MKTFRVILAFAALALVLAAPGGVQEVQGVQGVQGVQDEEPLRVGLLPVLDTLPFYVAEANGYFEEVGVEVEAVPVASPVERDQIMQAGGIDGMLNEMTTTATFNREAVQVQGLIAARIAYEDFPIFRVLAAPESDITSPADLAGVPVAVSLNTVIEYVTDRMLQAEGLDGEAISFQSVPAIPERFALLMQGQIKAATLPDPLAQAALEAGATLVIDDSAYPRYSVSLLSFSVQAIEEKPEAIRRFLEAWDMAVQDLNADPEAYRGLFLEKVNVPESVQESYEIPPFPRATLPDEDQWLDVIDWLKGKELLDAEAEMLYADSLNDSFLPDLGAALALYEQNCMACHGEQGVDATVGPDLAANDDLAALPAGEVHAIIANGVEGTSMPAFGDVLSAGDINHLVGLIASWNE